MYRATSLLWIKKNKNNATTCNDDSVSEFRCYWVSSSPALTTGQHVLVMHIIIPWELDESTSQLSIVKPNHYNHNGQSKEENKLKNP